MGWLNELPEAELKAWYKSQVKQRVLKHPQAFQYKDHSKQGLENHDYWSCYDYGDVIQFVYIKSASNTKRPRKEGFFEDYPERERPKKNTTPTDEKQRLKNSISRAKKRIFELAMCNEFTHFCTFTQDENMRDRFDLTEFRKDFAQLVRNLNREREEGAKIKYLLIPEKHKDGAWHMHGLLKGLAPSDLRLFTLSEKLPYKIRKQLKEGKKIFDWTRYRKAFGYFTATEIESSLAVSKYITKYITKDMGADLLATGQHLFFASQGLKSRQAIIKNSIDKCPIEKWDYENKFVKIFELKMPSKSEKTDIENDLKK